MGLYEDALASIDPNTGFVDVRPGSLWDQYSKQQEANLANMRATIQLSPELKYLQNNPDVLEDVGRQMANPNLAFDAALIDGKTGKERAVEAAARQHFIDYGQAEGRDSFGMPLSGFGGEQPANTMPVQTQPFNPVVVQPDPNQSTGGTGTNTNTNTMPNVMPAPMNLNAPLPGQLPGYDFVGDVNRYANSIGNFGGLLQNTNPFYAGQVPGPATQATPQTGGYNAPELSMYPNANYAAGAFPIIFTS